jgi:predicted phosphodiesterase
MTELRLFGLARCVALAGICVLWGLLAAVPARGQKIDLVAAKQDQDARIKSLEEQVGAEKLKANSTEVEALEKKLAAVRGEDLWSATTGTPAMKLQTGEGFHPFNFVALSDLHLSERKGKERLAKALELISKRQDIAFVIVLGDIVWDRDPEQFKPIIAKAGVPVHLVYGNNDWKWLANGTYEKALTPRDYTFTYNNCTFIAMYDCLPKGHFPEDHKGDFTPAQWTWLEQQLSAAKDAKATHIFTAMHIPPAMPGAFDPWFLMYTNSEKRFFELMEKYDASCGLFGHLHQAGEWKHDGIQCYVTPSCCWNFISSSRKVDSSFARVVKVEEKEISSALIPVRLEGETFTWETLAQFYNPDNHPK